MESSFFVFFVAQFTILEGQLFPSILAACTDIVIFSFPQIYPRYTCKFLPKIRGHTCFLGWAPFWLRFKFSSHKELRVLRQTAASEKQRHEEAEVEPGRSKRWVPVGWGFIATNWWWICYEFLLICSLKVGLNYQEFPGSLWTNECTYRHLKTWLIFILVDGSEIWWEPTCYT